MSQKKTNIPRTAVVSRVTTQKKKPTAKGMNRKQIAAERNYRICLHIVNVLHARGFITAKDTAQMTAFLLKRYRPLIGSLNYPKPRR